MSGTIGKIAKFTSANAVGDSAITESGGNVGIGTPAPVTIFHVAGPSDVDGNLAKFERTAGNSSDLVLQSMGSPDGTFGIKTQGAFSINTGLSNVDTADVRSDNVRLHIASNGNVGIGTTSPGAKLEVGKDGAGLRLTSPSVASWDLGVRNAPTVAGLQAGSFEILPQNGNTDFSIGSQLVAAALVVKNTGNVGIGTTAPTERLEVAGNIKASGAITPGSSRDIKRDISDVSSQDAMKAVMGLKPVKFRYKADTSGEEYLGFIAEDVPALVAMDDRKHLNPMDLDAVFAKVIQEQQRVIATLSAKVEALEGKIDRN